MDRQPLDIVRRLAFPGFREVSMPDTPESGIEETPLQFCKRINLPFTDMLLLTRALTHRSYINEHAEAVEDNERLEFLGDAVLDFVVGAWLYNHFPEMSEGQLTRMRSALVRNEQLARFARKLDLGPAMRLGRGEIQAGGRQRSALLCATFEALIGALYLQSGITSVQEFFTPFLVEVIGKTLFNLDITDPKSRLQEWSQARGLGTPHYRTKGESGPDHERVFDVEVIINGNVYGNGRGQSKQLAERYAALAAIDSIEKSQAGLKNAPLS